MSRYDLLIEDAGPKGSLVHVPAFPGLCFRTTSQEDPSKVAASRVVDYVRWLASEGRADLSPMIEELANGLEQEETFDLRFIVAEHVAGAPVWESGNAAVLFDRDLYPLQDPDVRSHLQLAQIVFAAIRRQVESLSEQTRTWKPTQGRRSIDETLEHLGNCVWWYCSRIDDALPEPETVLGEDLLDRIDRFLDIAESFLLGVPFSERDAVSIPRRFLTKDSNERWTHAKVCRREAEHAWAHLRGLQAVVHVSILDR